MVFKKTIGLALLYRFVPLCFKILYRSVSRRQGHDSNCLTVFRA